MEPHFYREIEALEGAKEIIQLRACVCLCWNEVEWVGATVTFDLHLKAY